MASASTEPSCPLCQNVLTDPVVLPCSHSFCGICLNNWREKNETRACAVCGRRSSMVEPPCHFSCPLHSETLDFYCLEHEQPVCVKCQSSENHKGHTFRDIEKAAEQHKKTLVECLQPLKIELRTRKDLKMKCDQVLDHIEDQAQCTEAHIRKEFERIRKFLEDEEGSRIRALREEEEHKTQRMKDKREAVDRDIAALTETIRSTEDDLSHHPVSFLHRYEAAVERAQQRPLLDDPHLDPGVLIDQAKHVGNLGFSIWNNMKELVPFSPVVLDPNTAGPRLTLSEDLTSVTPGEKHKALPDNPERINAKFYMWSVQGAEAFVSGTHTWEVNVEDNMNWQLGVATKSAKDRGKFDEMWGIWFSGNKYKPWTGPQTKFAGLQTEKAFPTIRVNLDFDAGELSFCDAESNTIIHHFKHTFTGKTLIPYFFNETVPKLKILPLKIGVTLK